MVEMLPIEMDPKLLKDYVATSTHHPVKGNAPKALQRSLRRVAVDCIAEMTNYG